MDPLVQQALEARKRAYAPFSKFPVGAALEAADGRIFLGCNVENSVYGATACAERVALWKAVSEGVRQFKRLAVVADTPEPVTPCGICRQVLFEFSPELTLILANVGGKEEAHRLSDLLPKGFRLNP